MFFVAVTVVGAFVLCYLPATISTSVTAKLGSSSVPVALRSTFLLLLAVNSALNPVIYVFRSKEFKLAFKKVLRGASVGREIENNNRARTGVQHPKWAPASLSYSPNWQNQDWRNHWWWRLSEAGMKKVKSALVAWFLRMERVWLEQVQRNTAIFDFDW